MKLAIVIPAHNEEKTITNVVRDVSTYGVPIVVDDGSNDRTSILAEQMGAVVLRHSTNLGYDAAIETGFAHAANISANIVVTFDADGQHDAKLVGEIYKILSKGNVSLVIGIRSKSARLAELIFNKYVYFRYGVPDILCGLKGYRVDLYNEYGRFDGTKSIGTGLALSALRKQKGFAKLPVAIRSRNGKPRLGSVFYSNFQILRAFFIALKTDLKKKDRTLVSIKR